MSESLAERDPVLPLGDHFRASARGVEVVGEPSRDHVKRALEQLIAAERFTWWAIGDILAWEHQARGDTKALCEELGVDYGAASNAKGVSRRTEVSRRRETLSFGHHQEVASLEEDEQDKLLDEAESEGYSQKQLRRRVAEHKRQKSRERIRDLSEHEHDTDEADIRLLRADCLDMIAELRDGSVSLLLTDPPYNVTENDWDMWPERGEYLEFMREWLAAMRPKMADESVAFVFCDARYTAAICEVLHDTDWPVLRQCIWHRGNLAKKRSGSKTLLSSYEPFWHCGTRDLELPDEWGDERFDVQKHAAPQSNGKTDPAYHPTQKPIALFERLVQLGSREGELVVDPFCGAGTTALACARNSRRCVSSDTSQEYIDIARGRLLEEQRDAA